LIYRNNAANVERQVELGLAGILDEHPSSDCQNAGAKKTKISNHPVSRVVEEKFSNPY
jgi:hypothetical protein